MNNKQLILSFILAFLFVATITTHAQNQDKRTWLNVYFGHQEYDGDVYNEMLGLNIGSDWAAGVGISRYIHQYWDLELSASYGKLDQINYEKRASFEKEFLNINGLLKFKPLKATNSIQPSIATGLGVTPFWGGRTRFSNDGEFIKDQITFQVPIKAGLDLRMTDNLFATINATYNRTFSDGFDGWGGQYSFDGRNHDDFLVYSIGLKFAVSKSTDRDGDGKSNNRDLCPDEYGESFWGCPDQDNDGTIDAEDECPTIAGSSNLNGCPDSDRDGVADMHDACPNTSGSTQSKGCPDSDGDGIEDKVDECPQQPGNRKTKGCPVDSGNDGLPDYDDQCLMEQGPVSNKGCPTESNKNQIGKEWDINTIAGNLRFSSNSSTLAPSSYDDLDRLAEIMLNEASLRLIIRGHTDNVGDDNENLELSIARANAVKEYLVAQGVSSERVFAFGYGETKPIASNETAEGRRQNRRVELELYTKQ